MKKLFLLPFLLCACQTPFVLFPNIDQQAQNTREAAPTISEIDKCEQQLPSCDLVTYTSNKDLTPFMKKCRKTKSKSTCAKDYMNMVYARTALKYPNANFDQATLWCKSEPMICDFSTMRGQAELEMKIRDSNEEKLEEIESDRRNQIQAQKDADNAARRRAIGAAYLQSRPTNCTSTRDYYGVIHTSCN